MKHKHWFEKFIKDVDLKHPVSDVADAIFNDGSYDLSEMTQEGFEIAARTEDALLDVVEGDDDA